MRDPIIDFVIDCYALYQSPAMVMKSLREKFGENIPSYHTVLTAKKKYRKNILERRAELEEDIAILNSKERWQYTQFILDDALEEHPILDRTGTVVGYARDRKNALMALKMANDMADVKGNVLDENDEAIRTLIYNTFDKLRKADPKADESELIKEILEALGEKAKPYLSDLGNERKLLSE